MTNKISWFNYFALFMIIFGIQTVSSQSTNDVDNRETVWEIKTLPEKKLSRSKRVSTFPTYERAFEMAICRNISLNTRDDQINKNRETCKINVRQLHFAHALIINPLNHSEFLYPDRNGNIEFKSRDSVFLSCADSLNYFVSIPQTRHETFLCICDNIFWAKGEMYNFEDLKCEHIPRYKVLDKCEFKTTLTAENVMNYHKFEIGFYTDDDKNFLKTMEIVASDDNATTMYTKSIISKSLAGRQITPDNFPFNPSHFYNNRQNVRVDDLYDINMQINAFKIQLPSQGKIPFTNRYLQPTKDYILTRGQLTPPSSMVYTAAAASTYAYLNVVPQWQTIKKGNWFHIENHVNEMAVALDVDLTVITGATYPMKLQDTMNFNPQEDYYSELKEMKEMYMYAARPDEETLVREYPIPSNLFKIVIDNERNFGVVYVIENNPYAKWNTLCEEPMIDISGVIMPKNWDPVNAKLGSSYVCEVQDFLKKSKIPFHEDITARSLLYIPDNGKVLATLAPLSTSPRTPISSTPGKPALSTPTSTQVTFLSNFQESLSYLKDTINNIYFEDYLQGFYTHRN